MYKMLQERGKSESSPSEIVEETSFHDVLVREVGAALQDEGGVDVEHLASYVAERQVAQNTEVPTTESFSKVSMLGCFFHSYPF